MNCSILLINGSLRSGSVNAAVLATAQSIKPENVVTRLYEGTANLPHFNPDDDTEPLNPFVRSLRADINQADAILFCTPEYAGALPGSFKNLLDWTVGGTEISGKPVGWINAASSAAPAGGEDAYASLRRVLGYVGARMVEEACIRIPVSRKDVDPEGLLQDPLMRQGIASALSSLAAAETE